MDNSNWSQELMGEARRVEPRAPLNWAALHEKELQWINTSTFEFAGAMREVYMRYGRLTDRQLAAVRKCMGVEAARRARPDTTFTGVDLRSVPDGNYSVPNGTTRLKVRIDRGTGKWQGYIFVSDAAEYGSRCRYGMQSAHMLYRGGVVDALKAIIADPIAASAAYGRLTGTCGVCGRKLEDEVSVARGIGPVCAEKFK